MKICFIAPANNYHTKKWCNWFTKNGDEVHVISFIDDTIEGATVHYIDTGASVASSDCQKIRYLFHGKEIQKIIKEIHPDIINAHYASSYGAATALAGINNFFLSVWGMDIYDFPKKSFIHKKLIEFTLSRASHIMSTSRAMAEETHRYTRKPIEITPFGVDMNLFNPSKRNRSNEDFVIGNIKKLTSKYGIDYLLKAVAIIRKKRPDIPIKVRIAGEGPEEQNLKKLTADLNLTEIVTWLGFISQTKAANEWANFDVGVISSISSSESFGVSAVECQACGVPVIITDPLGLQEATLPGKTSIVVPRKNEKALAKAIIDLYDHPERRKNMGAASRAFVASEYELNKCFKHIEEIFIFEKR